MAISKSNFVKKLLKDKNLNTQQREKVFELVARDFVNSDVELTRLWDEMQGLKKEVNLIKRKEEAEGKLQLGNVEEKDNVQTTEGFPKIPDPNPKHVADFMALFNQRDGLKYLTHDYDENSEFDIDKFLIAANKVFNEQTKKLNIPQSLWRIVKQFAFDSKQTEWSSISENYDKIIPLKIGWATRELRDWSKENNLHPIRHEDYRKIINDFKRITRIESSNLKALIDTTLKNVLQEDFNTYDINSIDIAKADFYSHVGFLKTAIEIILEEIKKRSDTSQKKKITFKYERSISPEGYYLRNIIITHHNSYPNKEFEVLLKEWHEKGNMGRIKEKFKGYCHWSVETIIGGTPLRVNILKEKNTPSYEQLKEDPKGFTHVLTYYYK